jgi:hypothetical protein
MRKASGSPVGHAGRLAQSSVGLSHLLLTLIPRSAPSTEYTHSFPKLHESRDPLPMPLTMQVLTSPPPSKRSQPRPQEYTRGTHYTSTLSPPHFLYARATATPPRAPIASPSPSSATDVVCDVSRRTSPWPFLWSYATLASVSAPTIPALSPLCGESEPNGRQPMESGMGRSRRLRP